MGVAWDVLDGGYAGYTSAGSYGVTDTSSATYDGVEEIASYNIDKEFTVERSLLTVNAEPKE